MDPVDGATVASWRLMRWPRLEYLGHVSLVVLEVVIATILAALVGLSIAGLGMDLPGFFHPPFLDADRLGVVLDHVLELFVMLELFATAVAYVRGRDVLRHIFEAALVAVLRKLITIDFSSAPLEKSLALSVLLAAIAASWWLLGRAQRAADLK